MSATETLKLKILDTEFQVKVEKGEESKILNIEQFVTDELGKIKRSNQFANHIHIAILGCLNIAEQLFEKETEVEDLKKAHEDELAYYKTIESQQNEQQEKLDKILEEKNEEIKDIQTQAEQRVREVEAANKKELEQVTEEKNKIIADLESKNREELEKLQTEKENIVTDITNSMNQKFNSFKDEKEREIQMLKQHYDQEVNKVTDEKDAIITNLKQDRQAQLNQITQEKDAIITRLRKERENELRNLHQEKDLKIEQLSKENETLTTNNEAISKDLDNKNELLNQYREKLKQSKDENDVNRQSIIDLQNQLFENQIELAKLQKKFESEGVNLNSNKSSTENDDQNLNELLYTLKNQKSDE